jgi:hypothetical protein
MTNQALGYEFEFENTNALIAEASPFLELASVDDLPAEIDYGQGDNVRSQGNTPSCRGHSQSDCAGMCARLANSGQDIDLDGDGVLNEKLQDQFSPLWCWTKAQVNGGTVGAGRGATMQGGIKTALESGICREVVYPFSKGHTTRFTSEMINDAARFKMGRYSIIDSEPKLRQWLGSGQGPAEWGTMWPFQWIGECLFDSAPGGRGGHATCCRGYWTGKKVVEMIGSRLPASTRSYIEKEPYVYVFRNSHGESAQFRGLYFGTRRGVEATLQHRHTTMIGWSDLSFPLAKVRKVDWSKVTFI